ERRHRGGVDDDAALLTHQLGVGDPFGGKPQHVEGADQVDVDDADEVLEWVYAVLAQHPDRVAGARAVHDDAQRAKGIGAIQRGGHAVGVGDVGGGEADAVAELLGDDLTLGRRQVENDHLRAVVQQRLGSGQPEPGGTTGHHRYPVVDLH